MADNGFDPQQRRNLLIAVALSAVVMLGFNFVAAHYFAPAPVKAEAKIEQPVVASVSTTVPQAIEIPLQGGRQAGAVNLYGGRLDSLTLERYKTEVSEDAGFPLLKASGDFAEYVAAGWMGAGIEGPNETSQWQVEADTNTTGKVALVWRNASGQAFQRVYSVRPDSYVVDVVDTVVNSANLPVSLTPYVQVHRTDGTAPNERPSWVNYFGPMGVVAKDADFMQYEDKYATLKKNGQSDKVSGTGGWWGITSQYFMVGVMPGSVDGKNVASERQFRYADQSGKDVYSASVSWPGVVVPAGGSTTVAYSIYAGPKHYPQLKAMGNGLDRAISWGWFEPLVKAFYSVLLWLHGYLHNWGLSVMAMTLLLKIATFPLANKSYHSMSKMRKLQPEIEKIKASHKDDQQKLAMATMELYKKHKVNPVSGCWPMFIQIPIFFAMYKVVLVMFEFRHAPLGLWITDMSVHDPYYVLPVIMGISMFIQFKLNPAPTDPSQAMVFKWMPAIMTFMFLYFPAGLVLYWVTNNVLSIAQQYVIMRRDKAI